MTAIQVQVRRDTASNLALTVPAAGELAYNTTRKRLGIGDGSSAGGIPHAGFMDIQESTFSYGTIGGTPNNLTITLTPAPSSYVTGLSVLIKPTANNTTAVTINVNGLGAKNIYKRAGGTIGALTGGDLLSGGMYWLVYDGAQFQIESTEASAASLSVSQGDLNTSSGTISTSFTSTFLAGQVKIGGMVTLSGGQYGFNPDIASNGPASPTGSAVWFNNGGTYMQNVAVMLGTDGSAGTFGVSFAMRQNYITSSPPFDMGDGDVNGFLFLLLDGSGNLVSHYCADVPPWGYNGPTRIKCDYKCPLTGKKFRRVQKRSFIEMMDGANPEYEMEEITHAIKNADMDLIPTPFPVIPAGHHVVLVDPMDSRIQKLIEYQNQGGGQEIIDRILKGDIYADNQKLSGRKGPKNINQYPLRFKYTRGNRP